METGKNLLWCHTTTWRPVRNCFPRFFIFDKGASKKKQNSLIHSVEVNLFKLSYSKPNQPLWHLFLPLLLFYNWKKLRVSIWRWNKRWRTKLPPAFIRCFFFFLHHFSLWHEFSSCILPTLKVSHLKRHQQTNLQTQYSPPPPPPTLKGSQTLIDCRHLLFHLHTFCRLLPLLPAVSLRTDNSLTFLFIIYFFSSWLEAFSCFFLHSRTSTLP